jgi:cytochrome c-type biogenesis protein CcmH
MPGYGTLKHWIMAAQPRIASHLRGLGVFAALLIVLGLLAACSNADIPPLERRSQELNQTIMCPVCPGESIDQSQNPLAVQMRGIVTEKVQQGWTDGQIKDFFVERYGPSVLMEPPRSGVSIVAWVLPPVGSVLAVVALAFVMRAMSRSRKSRPTAQPGPAQPSEEDMAKYGNRIEAALGISGNGAKTGTRHAAERDGQGGS